MEITTIDVRCMLIRNYFVRRHSNNRVYPRYAVRLVPAILPDDMSHVIQVISDAFLSGAFRQFAAFDQLVRGRTAAVLSRLIRPRTSSLRVSQRWLDEHEAAAAQRPRD